MVQCLAFLLLFISGCNQTEKTKITPPDLSHPSKELKLASFAPSNTELIYSLNCEDKLVGVCTECKYPKGVEKKPKIGSFIAAKYEKLASIKPDIALLVSGQETLASQLLRRNYKNTVLENNKLSDISFNLKTIGKLCNKEEKAKILSSQFDKAIDDLSEILAQKKRPKVLFCIWLNPSICIGGEGFLNDVITVCGGINSNHSFPTSYPKLTPEKIIAAAPEVVILPFEAKRF